MLNLLHLLGLYPEMVKVLQSKPWDMVAQHAELREFNHQRRAALSSSSNGTQCRFYNANNYLQPKSKKSIKNKPNMYCSGPSSKYSTVEASKCLKKSNQTKSETKSTGEEEQTKAIEQRIQTNNNGTVIGLNVIENVINESFTSFTNAWKVIFGDTSTKQVMTATSYSFTTEGRFSTTSQTSLRKRNHADNLDRFYDYLNSGIKVTRVNIPSKKSKRVPVERTFGQVEKPITVIRSFEADEELED